MLVGPESDEYARLIGQIADVRVLREFTHPNEDYPYAKIQPLAEIMAEMGQGVPAARRVGLGGRGLIGADMMAALRAALPDVAWIDVEDALCDLRAQKSPAEIAVIRTAYQIAEAGFDAAVESIRPGVTERAVAAEIEAAMRRAGAEGTGIDTIVASGPNTRPILARSTFRPIGTDDLVLLTIAPRYEGYHAAIGRVVLVGNPGAEIQPRAGCGDPRPAGVLRCVTPRHRRPRGRSHRQEDRGRWESGAVLPLFGRAQRRCHRV